VEGLRRGGGRGVVLVASGLCCHRLLLLLQLLLFLVRFSGCEKEEERRRCARILYMTMVIIIIISKSWKPGITRLVLVELLNRGLSGMKVPGTTPEKKERDQGKKKEKTEEKRRGSGLGCLYHNISFLVKLLAWTSRAFQNLWCKEG